MDRVDRSTIRRYLLSYQGLLESGAYAETVDYIRTVGSVQYDPLDVVGTNPELVLQARIEGFGRGDLHKLLYRDRLLVDGWDKMMSIFPVEDWPRFSRDRRRRADETINRREDLRPILPAVRSALEDRGPLSSTELRSLNLDGDTKISWPWGATRASRAALESLFWSGELVVHRREGSRKYYDLASRHIPPEHLDAPDPFADEAEYLCFRVRRRVAAVGALWNRAADGWLGIPQLKTRERGEVLSALVDDGVLRHVTVEDTGDVLYIPAAEEARLRAARSPLVAKAASILAPLDNLLWDRRLIRALFDFDYVWEVYKPAAERRFGYYVLPVLYGDSFVARFEPGREGDRLIIKNWWWEDGAARDGAMLSAIRACFGRFLGFLGAARLESRAAEGVFD